MTVKKLTKMPYAQAHVEITEDAIALFSYVTKVAEITCDEHGYRWLEIFGLYSQTTRRHIGAFVKEYCDLTYQDAKRFYEDGDIYCLDTGEVVSK